MYHRPRLPACRSHVGNSRREAGGVAGIASHGTRRKVRREQSRLAVDRGRHRMTACSTLTSICSRMGVVTRPKPA